MKNDMLLSPIQLKHLVFSKFSVEIAASEDPDTPIWAPELDATNFEYQTTIEVSYRHDQSSDPKDFIVELSFNTVNSENSHPPYIIDIVANGWFELDDTFPPEQREELVRVNGGSLIMSSIRELLMQTTSRFIYGQFLLPTFRFPPSKPKNTKKQQPKK